MNGSTEIQLRNELNLTRVQLKAATVKAATVQAENRRLRRMTQNGKTGRLLHRTAADARQLVAWRFSGYSISRRNCKNYGMSNRRWAWGLAMLRLAKIVPYPGSDTDAFDIDDFDQAIAAIDKQAALLAEQNDLGRLILRMHAWQKRRS